MAGASLLALLDDIATILDDVAILTKVAAKKTAGVVGDDLALSAEQVSGVRAERELPVVWAVAKGSAINKAILVPSALLISAIAPWAIVPLLMIGGAFLCFEGAEKILHKLLHSKAEVQKEEDVLTNALLDPDADLVAVEADKIKGAVRTDFILSAEIIVIALGSVAARVPPVTFTVQVATLVTIAVVMTVGVYGLVAGIVKLDDAGLALSKTGGDSASAKSRRAFGRGILLAAPKLMKTLSIVGTAAMFLVGGSILIHGIPAIHHLIEPFTAGGGFVAGLIGLVADGVVGILAGVLIVGVVTLIGKLRGKKAAHA